MKHTMKRYVPPEALVLLLVATVVLLPLASLGIYVYQKHQWAQNRLTDFEPRYARLAGLDANREALEQALGKAHAIEGWYLYSAEQDGTQTGNDAQQRIRSILSSAGMTVVSSQVLPAKDEKGIERIPLAVRAEGDIVSLQGALAGLAEQKPALIVDDMLVHAQGPANKGPQRLAAQFSLSVLRKGQP